MIGSVTDVNCRRRTKITAEHADRFDSPDKDDNGILTDEEIDLLVSNIEEKTGQMDRSELGVACTPASDAADETEKVIGGLPG